MKTKIQDKQIPDNIPELQTLVLDLISNLEVKESEIKNKDTEIELLRHKLQAQLSARFASKSEKNKFQTDLFDEAKESEQEELKNIEEADEEITIAAHTRKRTGRKPLPKNLPREQIIYDLDDNEKVCPCGTELHKVGEDTSEQLEWIPAQVKVIEHIRIKYGCRSCEEGIKIAPAPKLPIPKSIAAPGLLSEILVSKYVDHLPLYRQEQILQRMGVEIPRATLSSWMIKCGVLLHPLIPELKKQIISSSYIQADETTVQVLNEDGRSNTSKSYMWIFKGGPPDKLGVIFEYHPSRSGNIAVDFLNDFTGALQSDAYSGYMQFKSSPDISLYLCWAHARRKFADIVKVNKNKPGKAHMAINYIAKLYAIEKEARQSNLSFDERCELRQEKSLPTLIKFKKWLDDSMNSVPPRSPIGGAISYTLRHWDNLINYVDNGEVEIDNNLIENLIRPFALGRKNWLFHGSPKGAEAGAVIYSLIQTCRLNNIEPYAYFKYVLAKMPSYSKSSLLELLPQFIDKSLLNQAYNSTFL